MQYRNLREVPTDLVVTDELDWVYSFRHGVWGYRAPGRDGSYTRWLALRGSDWYSEFGPFEYTPI